MSTEGFKDSLAFVLQWEGGFVDNRADHGGRTNHGITQKVYDDWRAEQKLPSQDVKSIGNTEVEAIYEDRYWRPSRANLLSDHLDLVQFDTAVNMGVGRAIRFLQSAVGCEADGLFGPGTQQAVEACDHGTAVVSYCNLREQFYHALVAKDATQQIFLKGWMNRLNALRQAASLTALEGIAAPAPVDFGDTGYIGRVPDDPSLDEIRIRADNMVKKLKSPRPGIDQSEVTDLLEQLRNVRQYELLCRVAECFSRIDPKNAKCRRLYAQALIETGSVTVAMDVLQPLARRLPTSHPEWLEATGLLGRANKQMFFDASDKSSRVAREALKQAIAAYRKPFEHDPNNTWHGVNLLALLAMCRTSGVRVTGARSANGTGVTTDLTDVARQLIKSLESRPAGQRNEWYLPTLAEAYLGLDDWDAVERTVGLYASAKDAKAFLLASTLRQFTQIWRIQDTQRGAGLVNILRARLVQLAGGELQLPSADLQRLRRTPDPSPRQLEAVLGTAGAETLTWWKLAGARAESVVLVRDRTENPKGTGFVMRAGTLGLPAERAPADELVILTNFHVVNSQGAVAALTPDQAEVVFQALDSAPRYEVSEILWESPVAECDAAVLRLDRAITGATELPVAGRLPTLEPSARVYVIGHPGGRPLSISFQDNELLDHEGPPSGKPQIPGVCRVHYRAPTEVGSSGSPVFNSDSWQLIALHHMGGKAGMARLNGTPGTYAANEGIWIHSILEMDKKQAKPAGAR
jgi:lysozyme family protein